MTKRKQLQKRRRLLTKSQEYNFYLNKSLWMKIYEINQLKDNRFQKEKENMLDHIESLSDGKGGSTLIETKRNQE